MRQLYVCVCEGDGVCVSQDGPAKDDGAFHYDCLLPTQTIASDALAHLESIVSKMVC